MKLIKNAYVRCKNKPEIQQTIQELGIDEQLELLAQIIVDQILIQLHETK